MLKGSREVILRKVQPISIHGQISWDVHFSDPDDPDRVSVARVGPETVNHRLEPGDRIRLDYTLGAVVAVHRIGSGATEAS
jgi:predicted acyl esterase